MVLVLRRFYLQPNIPERNPVVKRDPTVLLIKLCFLVYWIFRCQTFVCNVLTPNFLSNSSSSLEHMCLSGISQIATPIRP